MLKIKQEQSEWKICSEKAKVREANVNEENIDETNEENLVKNREKHSSKKSVLPGKREKRHEIEIATGRIMEYRHELMDAIEMLIECETCEKLLVEIAHKNCKQMQ